MPQFLDPSPGNVSAPPEVPPHRRNVLQWLTYALGGLAAAALGIPIIGYILGSFWRTHRDQWIDLGPVEGFPENETRAVRFKNPYGQPWDGATGATAAYVRRLQGEVFLVFAVNCTHLGCPVSWFPQSGLFLCPCHGGAYYEDGARASGPPPRGLYRYAYEIIDDHLWILAGHLPTLQDPADPKDRT
jgi:nitrite reductase/ring-hydroxylating ferredoxin subunit